MSDKRISELPSAVTPLTGNELIPIVQDNVTKKVLASDIRPANATETVAGIAEIATQAEVNAAMDTSKIVTPATLGAYVEDKVSGLWDDRGNYDASTNAYPSNGGSGVSGVILKGDIWTISVGGTLPTGQVVEPGDTVRALGDSPGNIQANWAIAQNNIGYVAENAANKSTDVDADKLSNIKYPSTKAVYDFIIANSGKTSDKILYVSPIGSDANTTRAAHLGEIAKPFLTLEAARDAALSGDIIHVFPGTYTVVTTDVSGLAKDGISYYFEAGCVVNKATAGDMFRLTGFITGFNVFGYADFNKTGSVGSIWRCNGDIPFSATFEFRDCSNVVGAGGITGGCFQLESVYTFRQEFKFRNCTSTVGIAIAINYSCNVNFNFNQIRSSGGNAILAYEGSTTATFTGNLIESTAGYAVYHSWHLKATFNVTNVNGLGFGGYGFGMFSTYSGQSIILNGNTNGVYGTGYFHLNGFGGALNLLGGEVLGGNYSSVQVAAGRVNVSMWSKDNNSALIVSGGRVEVNLENRFNSTMSWNITGGTVILNGFYGGHTQGARIIDGETADVTYNCFTSIDAAWHIPWITLTNGILRMTEHTKFIATPGSSPYNTDTNILPIVKWIGGKLILNGASFYESTANKLFVQSRTASQALRVYAKGFTSNAIENGGLLAGKKEKDKFTISTPANTGFRCDISDLSESQSFTVLVSSFPTKAAIAQELVSLINASSLSATASQDTPGTDEYFYLETDNAGPVMTTTPEHPATYNVSKETLLLGSYPMTEIVGGTIIEDADVI